MFCFRIAATPSKRSLTGKIKTYYDALSDEINVEFKSDKQTFVNIKLSDLNGNIVQSKEENIFSGNNKFEIPAAELGSGVYFVNIYYKNVLIGSGKVNVAK
mgnify:CR=1 FL=1